MALRLTRIVQPILGRVIAWEARRMARAFRQRLGALHRVQQRTLLDKVRRNADSDFGRTHRFASIASVDDFRKALPVTTYADYEPYVRRVRNGQTSAMFGRGQRVHMFAMTSGTTSRPKYIPVTDAFLAECRRGWMTWGIQAYLDHPAAFQAHVLQLVSAMDDETAPSGLPCGAISGLMARMQRKAVRNVYVVPPEAARIKDTASKYYVALLLALRRRNLVIASANPSTLLGLARALDAHKESLLRDLHDGTVSAAHLDVPDEVRPAIEHRLRRDPARARRLEASVDAEGALLPKAVWNLPLVGCWKGGTLSLYLREFPRVFGAAPVRDIGLLASEGRMTIPLADAGAAGVLDVASQFFEFLPTSAGEPSGDRTLLPHELEVGGEYFILLTNSAGLYRYDIGDLVRVEGFLGGSPLVTFLNKGVHCSSLTGEKLSERQVVDAVNSALSETGFRLSSYCVAPVWTGEVPHYAVLVEEPEARDGVAVGAFRAATERLLRSLNIEYNAKRASGRLGPLWVKVVPEGTWSAFDQRTVLQRRRGMEQYKHTFLVGEVDFERRFPTVAEFGPQGPAE